jgi:hypothetical protein
MYLIDVGSGEKIEAAIDPVSENDFKIIKKEFQFDWTRHKGKEIYKLHILNAKKIQGLMCIVDHAAKEIDAIEIELLEVSEDNKGEDKKLDRIAGCLIAFACRESIKRGHDGYFFLIPKSDLIKHYQAKYHLAYIGPIGPNLTGTIIGEEKIARKLIREYLE